MWWLFRTTGNVAVSAHVNAALADEAVLAWAEKSKPEAWVETRLEALKVLIGEEAHKVFSKRSAAPLDCFVVLEGSFARNTMITDSDGDFVVVAYHNTAGGKRLYEVSRGERKELRDNVELRLKEAGDAAVLKPKHNAIGRVAFTCLLDYPGQGMLSFDVCMTKTLFCRPAAAIGDNPFADEPGAVAAVRALKVLAARSKHLFPGQTGSHAEALVKLQLEIYRDRWPTPAGSPQPRPGGLLLLLMVFQMFTPELDVQGLQALVEKHIHSSAKAFMDAGNITCWRNTVSGFLRRYTTPSCADDVRVWLLRGERAAEPVTASQPTAPRSSPAAASATRALASIASVTQSTAVRSWLARLRAVPALVYAAAAAALRLGHAAVHLPAALRSWASPAQLAAAAAQAEQAQGTSAPAGRPHPTSLNPPASPPAPVGEGRPPSQASDSDSSNAFIRSGSHVSVAADGGAEDEAQQQSGHAPLSGSGGAGVSAATAPASADRTHDTTGGSKQETQPAGASQAVGDGSSVDIDAASAAAGVMTRSAAAAAAAAAAAVAAAAAAAPGGVPPAETEGAGQALHFTAPFTASHSGVDSERTRVGSTLDLAPTMARLQLLLTSAKAKTALRQVAEATAVAPVTLPPADAAAAASPTTSAVAAEPTLAALPGAAQTVPASVTCSDPAPNCVRAVSAAAGPSAQAASYQGGGVRGAPAATGAPHAEDAIIVEEPVAAAVVALSPAPEPHSPARGAGPQWGFPQDVVHSAQIAGDTAALVRDCQALLAVGLAGWGAA